MVLEIWGQDLLTKRYIIGLKVLQIPAMPDHILVELGVLTIGSRLQIRSAASHLIAGESGFSFVDLDIVCSLILLQISAPAR